MTHTPLHHPEATRDGSTLASGGGFGLQLPDVSAASGGGFPWGGLVLERLHPDTPDGGDPWTASPPLVVTDETSARPAWVDTGGVDSRSSAR
jgi:hypothetical protein